MTTPVPDNIDKRDLYRGAVDKAVIDYATAHQWSIQDAIAVTLICYRTVCTESDWRNLANLTVPESMFLPHDGLGMDKDSVGLYQQRAQYGWGSCSVSMDPYRATTSFLTGMTRKTPGWRTCDASTVCQRTQESQYDGVTVNPVTGLPYPFAANYFAKEAEVGAIAADELYWTHSTVKLPKV